MSANYHSFRNIGFLFTQAEAICEKWRKVFTGFDPVRAVSVYGLKREEPFVYVNYFDGEYRLCCENGILEKRVPGQQSEEWTKELFMNEAMVIYHLLGDVKEGACLSGEWVPEPDLDPVRIRSGNRTDPLVGGFARAFAGRIPALEKACIALNGTRLERGDSSWQIHAMPLLPMQLIFWDADEEFPAQVQVLVDRNITDFMHFEAAGCMIADLFEKIGDLAGEAKKR